MNSNSSSRSANSNSKRSRDSAFSSRGDGGKKKDTAQKTLGMAWGSNSRSSSRSSFRSAPFSNFGSYMAVKNRKLHEQFDAEASTSSYSASGSGKPIFQGVSIFVDGYTVPSSQELRTYMLKHGGRFENYFSRHRVTHIICSNLPNSKIKNLRSFSGGLPVVKPTWVLDSVAANKLLSWVPYQLDQVASESNNQPKLSSFFVIRSSPDDVTNCVASQMVPGTEDSSQSSGMNLKSSSSDVGETSDYKKQHCGRVDAPYSGKLAVNFLEEHCSKMSRSEAVVSEKSDVGFGEKSLVETQPESSSFRPSDSVSSHCLDNQNAKASSSVIGGSANHPHSTLEDPNFVENYFKNSRLHFIGTWRNRYRKRFPILSGGFRTSSSSNVASESVRNTIIHIDMDCFFVAVVIRNCPELWDKPVAVCHSNNTHGTAEISSANYPARGHGVRAGIFVRDAKALCPNLVILPYDFNAYEEVADHFYCILHKHCKHVQAISCDEAFLDVTDSAIEDPQQLASVIRKEIFDTTGCTASAGVSGNMLMARLATRTAKPDGQCYLPLEEADNFLKELQIKALPGIGRSLEEKLKSRHVKTCGELRMISKESLQKDFGSKTGEMLWNYSRGIDDRLVGLIQERKSIGAEVNWGVRFKEFKDSQEFLLNLCKEVSLRLQGCGVQGRHFTLKIKKRKADAEEPVKYMGCGDCENLSHSITIPMATDDVEVLKRIAAQLFGSFHIDVKDIRGMGLQVSKLVNAEVVKQGGENKSIRSWLESGSARTTEQCGVPYRPDSKRDIKDEEQISCNLAQLGSALTVSASGSGSALPPLSELDMGVIESLPSELFAEMDYMYGGKLLTHLSKHKCRSSDIGNLYTLHGSDEGLRCRRSSESRECTADYEGKESEAHDQIATVSMAGTSDMVRSAAILENVGLMPSSLSQVDVSVLQQLPEELRIDILGQLRSHRNPEYSSGAGLGSRESYQQDSSHLNISDVQTEPVDDVLNKNLFIGNPPQWVENFKVNDCEILKVMAALYGRLGPACSLSSVLLWTMSETRLFHGQSNSGGDDAISSLCDLLKQYIELKLALDIEEVYTCFRLLRRLSEKSEFFLKVFDIMLPQLQDAVVENYGGTFQI